MWGQVYDLAIIGGGINGCGIARDAVGRGLSVFLCEQGDLGGGASSASTKLVHGGLRPAGRLALGEIRAGAGGARPAPGRGAACRPSHALRASAPRRQAVPRAAQRRRVSLRPACRPQPARRRAGRRPRRRPAGGDAAAGLRDRLRIFRLHRRRCPPRRPQRDRRPHPRRRDQAPGPLRRRRARGHGVAAGDGGGGRRALCDRGADAGQRRRALGARRPQPRRPCPRPPGGPPGQGQPHRRPEALRARPRLCAPQRRRTGHLRRPLPARLHADRHHRGGLSRRSGRGGGRQRRDRLPDCGGRRVFPAADLRGRRRLGLVRRPGAPGWRRRAARGVAEPRHRGRVRPGASRRW